MGSRAKHLSDDTTAQAANEQLSPFEKVTKWFEVAFAGGYEGHDSVVLASLKLESVDVDPTPANPHSCKVVMSLVVDRKLCNMTGALHGGAVALIFDICTSTAIMALSKPGFWDAGHVSRNLNCTYLRPVMEGQKVFVDSEVVSLGKRMAMTRAVIKTEDGKICSTCEHGKVALGGPGM